MTNLFIERRNKQIMVQVERRQPQKEIARLHGLRYGTLRVIIFRLRHLPVNILDVDKQKKSA